MQCTACNGTGRATVFLSIRNPAKASQVNCIQCNGSGEICDRCGEASEELGVNVCSRCTMQEEN